MTITQARVVTACWAGPYAGSGPGLVLALKGRSGGYLITLLVQGLVVGWSGPGPMERRSWSGNGPRIDFRSLTLIGVAGDPVSNLYGPVLLH